MNNQAFTLLVCSASLFSASAIILMALGTAQALKKSWGIIFFAACGVGLVSGAALTFVLRGIYWVLTNEPGPSTGIALLCAAVASFGNIGIYFVGKLIGNAIRQHNISAT